MYLNPPTPRCKIKTWVHHCYLPFPPSTLSCTPFPTIHPRSPPDKFLQILSRSHAQNKPSRRIRYDGKILWLASVIGAGEEGLKLLEWGVHGDEFVPPALALEAHHGLLNWVGVGELARVQLGAQPRDREVTQQRFGVRIQDGEMGIVAFVG